MAFTKYNVKLYYVNPHVGRGPFNMRTIVLDDYEKLKNALTMYLIDPEIKCIDIRKEHINEEPLSEGKEDG